MSDLIDYIWKPTQSRIDSSVMKKFMNTFDHITSYKELHKFSVTKSDQFWTKLINFFHLDYEGSLDPINLDYSFNTYGWLPNVKLNFAKNLLQKGRNQDTALTSILENGHKTTLSYLELKNKTALLQNYLKKIMGEGDVLACYMPNISETVISMLATTSLGGIFTSTSCDFGVEGVIDRFSQSEPKVLVSVSGYNYNGKYISLIDRLVEIQKRLPSLKKIIIVNFLDKEIKNTEIKNKKEDISQIEIAKRWEDCLDLKNNSNCSIEYNLVQAHSPLYIMYSSGTTGKPKCIVHSVGGTLLQHIKELGLHCDLTSEKKIMYFTTCGWMMWNWLASSLYFGANIYLYEGSPSFPSINDFFKIVDSENINIWGTSPKFLKVLEESNYNHNFKLKELETILSTGAPLLDQQYSFVYKKIKEDLLLASISGGTDIIGCFMLGNPLLGVIKGQIQCLGLGMDVASFNPKGEALLNIEGELVCKKSFPSRPLSFLNDHQNIKIKNAYFKKFKNVWHHGDYITITKEQNVIVHGRSDATLNPGGVRIGTAEIYRQTEQLDFIEDSICVGQEIDGEVSVLLFVKLKNDKIELDQKKISIIKKKIRSNTTSRHVPRFIYKVTGIPYTRSGKKMEIAVTRLVAGRELTNLEAVSNPDCLGEYITFSM